MSPGKRSHDHTSGPPRAVSDRPVPLCRGADVLEGFSVLAGVNYPQRAEEHARPGAVDSASGPGVRYSADMLANTSRLTSIVEGYLEDLRRVRASGGATAERSTYTALANLFDSIGATLRPKVVCVSELADQGEGHPDFGLYAASQVQRGTPRQGQAPECGVVEVKPPDDDTLLTAEGD